MKQKKPRQAVAKQRPLKLRKYYYVVMSPGKRTLLGTENCCTKSYLYETKKDAMNNFEVVFNDAEVRRVRVEEA